MMLYKPTLIINRLVAIKSSKVVFNEAFHNGVNVLFGVNGGGKTSVVQLAVYGLGYEVKKWKQEAGSCDYVFLEVSLNDAVVTLRRKIDGERQGMDVFFGAYEAASRTGVENWFSYPYSVSSKESFSQKIFSLLEVPEVSVESTNITLHQILRLIYNDQSNPASSIFNVEQFDSAFKRESIGNYLLGMYDNGLYAKSLELIEKNKRLDSVISESRAIYAVLGKSGVVDGLGNIESLRNDFNAQLEAMRQEALDVKRNSVISFAGEKAAISGPAVESVGLKIKLANYESEISALKYEIEDSNNFIKELVDKNRSISDSMMVNNYSPRVIFDVCPSCYTAVKPREHGHCGLCGAELDESQKNTNLLRMKNEVQIQLDESKGLLKRKAEELVLLNEKRKETLSLLRVKINQVEVSASSLNSDLEKKSFDIYRRIGEAEERLSSLSRMEELYAALRTLSDERERLQEGVNALKDEIDRQKAAYLKRIPHIKEKVSELVCSILRLDIGSESEFKNAEAFEFDFASNAMSVNGKSYFSESSMFLLNNAFHLALLRLSTLDALVRLPRLMILDGIENGGMQEDRSKNFQKIVRDFMAGSDVKYQIIIATKNADESLRSEEYVVGKFFSEGGKSLAI